MTLDPSFWRGRKVLITGHTGFKGAWASLLLHRLGAAVSGYSLDPPTQPSLYSEARCIELLAMDIRGDVRDVHRLADALGSCKAEIVIHMAAQSLVRESYRNPVETFSTNLLGTVSALEAVRRCPEVKAVVVVTSDKCYENDGRAGGYRETDPMGGYDPYSASKGCAELAASSMRRSFFSEMGSARIATARAGNVIGGGDWAEDRLIPDAVRAWEAGEVVLLRNPQSIRPWQHVLDPLNGYLMLAERLHAAGGERFAGGWNFGPADEDVQTVGGVIEKLTSRWPGAPGRRQDAATNPHEASLLKLDCGKAREALGWRPLAPLELALDWIAEWNLKRRSGGDVREITLSQIDRFLSGA